MRVFVTTVLASGGRASMSGVFGVFKLWVYSERFYAQGRPTVSSVGELPPTQEYPVDMRSALSDEKTNEEVRERFAGEARDDGRHHVSAVPERIAGIVRRRMVGKQLPPRGGLP